MPSLMPIRVKRSRSAAQYAKRDTIVTLKNTTFSAMLVTDFGHTKAKSQILFGSNSNPTPK